MAEQLGAASFTVTIGPQTEVVVDYSQICTHQRFQVFLALSWVHGAAAAAAVPLQPFPSLVPGEPVGHSLEFDVVLRRDYPVFWGVADVWAMAYTAFLLGLDVGDTRLLSATAILVAADVPGVLLALIEGGTCPEIVGGGDGGGHQTWRCLYSKVIEGLPGLPAASGGQGTVPVPEAPTQLEFWRSMLSRRVAGLHITVQQRSPLPPLCFCLCVCAAFFWTHPETTHASRQDGSSQHSAANNLLRVQTSLSATDMRYALKITDLWRRTRTASGGGAETMTGVGACTVRVQLEFWHWRDRPAFLVQQRFPPVLFCLCVCV
ncbi:hypothetical protein N8602_00285 [bacterium]|nr:hypothetical protein [bacterium]